ncbi:MAG: histidine--tRNA ligase, partial [Actinobacteria bacterium]|nr:histidine--tRNA ligase [Actinomycetota bacterium]
DLDLLGRSPKGQLKHAARLGAAAVVFVGLSELPADTVRVRLLGSGEELDVPADGVAAWLRERLEGGL